jgi:hypothetical protein
VTTRVSAMYELLLQQHIDDKKAYGESAQPPCGPQELERARARAKAELGVDLHRLPRSAGSHEWPGFEWAGDLRK